MFAGGVKNIHCNLRDDFETYGKTETAELMEDGQSAGQERTCFSNFFMILIHLVTLVFRSSTLFIGRIAK